MRAARTAIEQPLTRTATTTSPPARANSARRRAPRVRPADGPAPGRVTRPVISSPLLENDDPLARPRDRVSQLRVRIAHRLDLLELELVEEPAIPDHGLERAKAPVEDARDPVLEHR